MERILARVATADAEEVEALLTAVLTRYGELYPDWEISTISLRKDQDRAKQLDKTIQMLEKMKRHEAP